MDNNSVLIDSIKKALFETFEEMAFIDIEEAQKIDKGEYQQYKVTIAEPIKYSLIFSFSSTIIAETCENILFSTIDELDQGQINDCIFEVINIIAGNFILQLDYKNEQIVILPPTIYNENNDIMHNEKVNLSFKNDENFFNIRIFQEQ